MYFCLMFHRMATLWWLKTKFEKLHRGTPKQQHWDQWNGGNTNKQNLDPFFFGKFDQSRWENPSNNHDPKLHDSSWKDMISHEMAWFHMMGNQQEPRNIIREGKTCIERSPFTSAPSLSLPKAVVHVWTSLFSQVQPANHLLANVSQFYPILADF